MNSREDEIRTARAELDQRGVPFSEEDFVRYICIGNIDLVSLYLRAGISPDATPDGESAFAASANQGHKEIAPALINAGAKPLGLFDGLKTCAPKNDLWEMPVNLSGVFPVYQSRRYKPEGRIKPFLKYPGLYRLQSAGWEGE